MDKSSASTGGAQTATTITDSVPSPQPDTRPPITSTTTSSQTSKQSSTSASLNHSPAASRDASPSRKPRRTALTGSASQSRRNSQQDLSPTRQAKSTCTEPSSAAAPSLRSTTKEPPILSPTPQKPPAVQDLKDSHRWPVSPRLRSPPPQLSKLGLPDSLQNSSENDSDESHMQSGIRTPVCGALETVQEVSQNNSPAHAADASLLEHVKEKLATPGNPPDSALSDGGLALNNKTYNMPGPPGSGDVGGSRPESRRPSSVPPPPPTLVSRQSSAMSTKQAKSKPEGSTQNMTVETETVPSVPQVVLATGTKAEAANGTLKTKPSAETIRPKREKKKPARKQPAVNSGTGSSKADIFEAKIANAVDEANTSDSEETFVYDSNPPDNTERSTRRFHSRTPSATSMVSQADRPNLRSLYGVLEGGSHGHGHGPVPKKSMKFVNTFGGNASDSLTPGDEDGKGTGRSTGGSARGTLRHHHHIGRWGRQPGNGHASLFDNESPFPNAAKSKLAGNTSRNSSGPTSPRNYHSARGQFGTKRSAMQMSSSYDLDDTTGADDERTPLIETARSLRGSRSRRGPHSLRQAESQTYTRRSSYLNRFAACLVLTMMFLLVITGAIGFMFATSQPMTGIEIVSIGNVVTSEQVLMYDLTVKAHNPNIVVVTIDRANLEIFAKSKYADEDSKRRKHHHVSDRLHARDDPANDPPLRPGDGDSDSRPNILLGRVTVFDSSLTFEGSLFHQGTSSSTGQMQLPSPGNNTVDGSERWNNIYQHEFDLIVKGVVKYSLPLSAHVRSATVSGRTTVKPNSANNPSPKPNITVSVAS
ncbi:vacuolar segregation subunit 7 domain-containing protein [Hirsutella rhossiliensis]|uniref:Vacuolar segregation subunit 7 domain-containing protein n=1 Tax=Hirsutella rhossiliensis TaxID=111463 RepID=A0A9P8MQP1_9HYPO|nr:vacuolar segregation subunit 7 domain-containing protein [Hirsutella rhossiliensis]KAH0959409.1 vacuolar segregation subunit 7 domain-containing protein [Hirsutella rhossiliensis]